MRQLLLLRGAPASGKSTYIEEYGFDRYTLSSDKIRELFGAVQYDKNGCFTISQKYNDKVWKTLMYLLEERMKEGITTVIDATNCKLSDIYKYTDLCRKYRYELYVKEFKVSEEECIERNKRRPQYQVVPDEVIHNMCQAMELQPLDKNDKRYTILEDDYFPVVTPSSYIDYDKIIAIGDIHGCIQPLQKYFIDNPIKDNYLYIFMGDYFDRGKYNTLVFELLEMLQKRNNFVFLTGNHDWWLMNYVNNSGEVHEQTRETIREFVRNGILKNRLKPFISKQKSYFSYKNKYYFTHGGITNPLLVTYSDKEFVRGVGSYNESHDVDEVWSSKDNILTRGLYSIHAHRNVLKEPIYNTERTFNLCDEVEFGGYLRVLEITLADNSFKEVYVKNEQS